MTDTMNTEPQPQVLNPFVQAALTEYNEKAAIVARIDEELNLDGGAGALARAAVEAYPNKDAVTTAVTNMVADVGGQDLLAVDTLIRRVLRSVASQVKEYLEANKTEAPTVSEEDQVRLRADRKAAVDAANLMRSAIAAAQPGWAADNLDTVMPLLVNKKGAGPGGKRAPRLHGKYQWTVDGEFVGGAIADVNTLIGIPGPELKDLMVQWYKERGTKLDTEDEIKAWFKDAPARIDFKITRGEGDKAVEYHVVGKREESDVDEDETDSDSDEDFSEDDTEATAENPDEDLFG